MRPLQLRQQRVDAREVLIRIAVVPDPHRQQREDVHEVVVEQDRELGAAGGLGAALLGEEVQDVDRDDVGIGLLRHAVPVVQDVKPFGAGAAVVGGDRAIEKDLVAAGAKLVGAHRLARARVRPAPSVFAAANSSTISWRADPCKALSTNGAGLFERDVQS